MINIETVLYQNDYTPTIYSSKQMFKKLIYRLAHLWCYWIVRYFRRSLTYDFLCISNHQTPVALYMIDALLHRWTRGLVLTVYGKCMLSEVSHQGAHHSLVPFNGFSKAFHLTFSIVWNVSTLLNIMHKYQEKESF